MGSIGTASTNKIRPRMHVRRSIMYEKGAFCSPEVCSPVVR